MSDIFLSYARDDLEIAERFVTAFEAKGWSVWWDRRLGAGEVWDTAIETNIEAARLVVVLWSPASVNRRWVRNEARFAKNKDKLVTVLIRSAEIPLEFTHLHEEDLSAWRGELDHVAFRKLAEAIENRLGVAPIRAAASAKPAESHANTVLASKSPSSLPSLHPHLAADPSCPDWESDKVNHAIVERRISSSNRLFEVGLEALIRVQAEYLAVRRMFDSRQGFGPRKWTDEQRIEIEKGPLNRFLYEIERSKIVLDGSVTNAFRKIYLYLSELLDEDDHKPSIYVRQISELDERLDAAIHKMIG